ncbi:hypothetical protein Esti_002297 [Eimeria stiedai]
MQYHANEKLNTYLDIEKLHVFMEAHKALALQALGQQDSALSSDVVQSLNELVKAIEHLDEQFKNVSESLSWLTLLVSTASTAEASANMTAEAAKFMALHEVCLVKLKQTQHFFDSGDVSCVEGSEVLKAAMESAFLRCEADHSAEIIQRVAGEIEAMEQSIIDAMNEVWTALDETLWASFKDDLELLERVHKARSNMARLRRKADEYSAFLTMVASLELDLESSIIGCESVEQGQKGEGMASRSENVNELLKQFRARHAKSLERSRDEQFLGPRSGEFEEASGAGGGD